MRKRRPRSHIIADLSVNHLERYALLCGYTVERVQHDYGIDLLLYTYDANGEPENDAISIQLKATDKPTLLQDGETISLTVERADLERWLSETMPVLLVLYDAQANLAYWIYAQSYFAQQSGFRLTGTGATATVHFSKSNLVNEDAIRKFAQFKASVLRQFQGVTHDDK